ncbi:UNVERIFIED_CONTAM: hypothetical protein PYX00_011910 [Menopon gallinae]|uniref:RecF/RecN/SMC N-terminal domain-containing protein n=1 Tax=Menopon gallinae TaxID=328185 RepID=A0AAW2H9H0_9NEOP
MACRLIILEITGFKSFCKKQVIPFDREFTAIVGPNGCGKSNILEAIFWALGESSVSNLRLEKGEDILFNAEKDSRFFAEVSLILEKQEEGNKKALSLVATRRYYSNAQNVYYLNKVEVKSSVYNQTLQQWGLFRSAYMLMPQGKIDALMAKSGASELKHMLEEVAGLSALKAKKEETLKNILKSQEHLREWERMWAQTSLRHEQLKLALDNQSKAETLQKECEEYETQILLLDLYRLHLRMEAIQTQTGSFSLEESQKELFREEQAVEMQTALARERLKDAQAVKLECEKELSCVQRCLEIVRADLSALNKDLKMAEETYEQSRKKVSQLEQKLNGMSQNTDSQMVHLNKLLSMEEELELRSKHLQNQLRKGLYDIIEKLPRGFRRELERMQFESQQISEFLSTNDSLIFELIEQFLLSSRSFLGTLEQIDWEYLESSYRDAYEELLSVENSLERQVEKVVRFRAAQAKEKEAYKQLKQELKDAMEEETFHKNNLDKIRLKKEGLDANRQTWEESLNKWKVRRDKACKDDERFSRLLRGFEEEQRYGKRKNMPTHLGCFSALQELYECQGEFLALKKQLRSEGDWNEFLSVAKPSLLEDYNRLMKEKELAYKSFLPLRLWLSGDKIQEDFCHLGERFEQLVKEKEDLEKAIKESKNLLKMIEKEAKKSFSKTLDKLNKHLREISLSMLGKASIYLEEAHSGLVFKAEIKGQGRKTLRAFSGGEKTLVFLSLLMAVYAVAEVPFTFLDEIDAALDEENSNKWVNLLKQISQNRQLVLITHNPIVARCAKQILGVTLDKKGYSEIYSLDLSEDYSFV